MAKGEKAAFIEAKIVFQSQTLFAILLAAGSGARLQKDGVSTPKPLVAISGKTLLRIAVENCAEIADPLVVLGHEHELVAEECRKLNARFCVNSGYRSGQTSSLKAGLKRLPPQMEAFFIYPVDYPFIQKGTMRKLSEAFWRLPSRILVPAFQGKRGHPPLVPALLKESFLRLGNEEPASKIIRENPKSVIEIEVEDSGILRDLDTKRDLERVVS